VDHWQVTIKVGFTVKAERGEPLARMETTKRSRV